MYDLLTTINYPHELRALDRKQLPQLARVVDLLQQVGH